VPEVRGLKERVVPFEEAIACPRVTCEFHPKNGRKPRKLEGTRVVVWGDHYAAVDTATYLASIGKEVIIVTDRKEFASSVEVIHMRTWKRLPEQARPSRQALQAPGHRAWLPHEEIGKRKSCFRPTSAEDPGLRSIVPAGPGPTPGCWSSSGQRACR
jgi:hypothetical protein